MFATFERSFMKLYERCAKAIAAVLLGFLVLLVAELIRVQPGAKNIHTPEESLNSTQWENAIRLEPPCTT